MSKTFLLALGILLTIVASVSGLVLIPNWQFRELQPLKTRDGREYPVTLFGDAAKGREVYIDQGCIYCHSQQVRMKGYGADLRRGWGTRRSVARDYLFQLPHQLGTMRTGPDLANIGARQPSDEWHYLHLYRPVITSPGSIMPEYDYLFDVIPVAGRVPARAIKVPAKFSTPQAAYIVPRERGLRLVAYLKSLNQWYPLPEANR
jgi:cytochrome c oxidase cbb3-type subunit 2